MILKIFITTVLLTLTYAKCPSCPNTPRLYDELKCYPIKPQHSKCPQAYSCPDFNSFSKSKCHYRGISYNIGQIINGTDAPPCSRSCRCSANSSGARFTCPIVDCFARPVAGCVVQHKLSECCANDKICGDDANKLPTCTLLGKVYKQGDAMYPENGCYKCICNKSFSSSIPYKSNKNCEPINCGVELRAINKLQQGCAPIFNGKTGCCPIDYRCPAASDIIVPPPEPVRDDYPKYTCKFGKLTLHKYYKLNPMNSCTDCICINPPMVQCTQQPNCIPNSIA